MTGSLPSIISINELLELQQKGEVIIIDARSGKNAKTDYDKGHLTGALWIDLESQLAEIKDSPSLGGRHPLPSAKRFSEALRFLGISPDSHVVVYDDKGGANAAARFWWMLKAAGHKKIQVLDGGIQKAAQSGYPMNGGIERPEKEGSYAFNKWKLPLAKMEEVERATGDPNSKVIDVRESGRYKGEFEPIDLVAGHIPGAVNIPFTTNLNEEGYFKSPTELKENYQEIFNTTSPKNIIVHCGSGVTACHSLLAMAHAGYEIPKLYVGSWSEWSGNDKPIAKNETTD